MTSRKGKKQINKKLVYGILFGLLAIFLVSAIVTTIPKPVKIVSNIISNVQHNDGRILQVKKDTYFVDTVKNKGLYVQDKDKKITKIFNKMIKQMNYFDGYIYYVADSDSLVYKMNIKSKSSSVVYNEKAKKIMVVNKKLYVLNEASELFKMNLNGSSPLKVVDVKVDSFAVIKDDVYYLYNKNLYVNDKKVIDFPIETFVIDEKYVVLREKGEFFDFLIAYDRLTMTELKTVEPKINMIGSYTIDGDKLYVHGSIEGKTSPLHVVNLTSGTVYSFMENETNLKEIYKTHDGIIAYTSMNFSYFYVREKLSYIKEYNSDIDGIFNSTKSLRSEKILFNDLYYNVAGSLKLDNQIEGYNRIDYIKALVDNNVLKTDKYVANETLGYIEGKKYLELVIKGESEVYRIYSKDEDGKFYLVKNRIAYMFDPKNTILIKLAEDVDAIMKAEDKIIARREDSFYAYSLDGKNEQYVFSLRGQSKVLDNIVVIKEYDELMYYNFNTTSENRIPINIEELPVDVTKTKQDKEAMYLFINNSIYEYDMKRDKIRSLYTSPLRLVNFAVKKINDMYYIAAIEADDVNGVTKTNLYTLDSNLGKTYVTEYNVNSKDIRIENIENNKMSLTVLKTDDNLAEIFYDIQLKEARIREVNKDNYEFRTADNKNIRVVRKTVNLIERIRFDVRTKEMLIMEE